VRLAIERIDLLERVVTVVFRETLGSGAPPTEPVEATS
jgi:hypothetical protein